MRDSADFFLLGYGGNASPFPSNCSYPPGYVQDYPPSLLRIERTPRFVLANLITQLGNGQGGCRCGIFDTGFAGEFYSSTCWSSVYESGAGATEALDWPVLYAGGV